VQPSGCRARRPVASGAARRAMGSGASIPLSNSPEGIKVWLARESQLLTPEDIDECCAILAADGATNLALLTGAGYTREDLISLKVKRAHIAILLKAIEDFKALAVQLVCPQPGISVTGRRGGLPRQDGQEEGIKPRLTTGHVCNPPAALPSIRATGTSAPRRHRGRELPAPAHRW
jgi:hypothetical protein